MIKEIIKEFLLKRTASLLLFFYAFAYIVLCLMGYEGKVWHLVGFIVLVFMALVEEIENLLKDFEERIIKKIEKDMGDLKEVVDENNVSRNEGDRRSVGVTR